METVQFEEAQAHLAEWIEGLAAGREVIIARSDRAVAKLGAAEQTTQKPCFGSVRGKIIFAPDWDDPITDASYSGITFRS